MHSGDAKVAEMMNMYDLDGNGVITIDEFEHMLCASGFTIVEDAR